MFTGFLFANTGQSCALYIRVHQGLEFKILSILHWLKKWNVFATYWYLKSNSHNLIGKDVFFEKLPLSEREPNRWGVQLDFFPMIFPLILYFSSITDTMHFKGFFHYFFLWCLKKMAKQLNPIVLQININCKIIQSWVGHYGFQF